MFKWLSLLSKTGNNPVLSLSSNSDCKSLSAVSIPISPRDIDPPVVKRLSVGIPRRDISSKIQDNSLSLIPLLSPISAIDDLTALIIPGDSLASR